MKRREIASLLLAAAALATFLFQVVSSIAVFLPGFSEELDWLFDFVGLGKPPEIYSNPFLGLAATFTCITPFALLMGAVSFLLWRSAATDRRREAERLHQTADWGTTALLHWIENALTTALDGDSTWTSRLEQGRAVVLPHLAGLHRRLFERILGRAASGGSVLQQPDVSAAAPRRWPTVAFNVLLVIAAAQVGLAAIGGVAFAALERYPVLGMPLGKSAVFEVAALFLSLAIVSTFLAFAVRRLGRSTAVLEVESERHVAAAAERLTRGALETVGRAAPSAGTEAHRLASLIAVAFVEAVGLDRRPRVLEDLYTGGLLRAPGALDLRGCRIGPIDLGAVEWPGVVLAGASLDGVDFSDAVLDGADLSSCGLRGAALQGATLVRARLRGSALTGASAQRASFRDADLAGCDMTGMLLWGADLSGADLTDAKVDPGSSVPELQRRATAAPGVAS